MNMYYESRDSCNHRHRPPPLSPPNQFLSSTVLKWRLLLLMAVLELLLSIWLLFPIPIMALFLLLFPIMLSLSSVVIAHHNTIANHHHVILHVVWHCHVVLLMVCHCVGYPSPNTAPPNASHSKNDCGSKLPLSIEVASYYIKTYCTPIVSKQWNVALSKYSLQGNNDFSSFG